MISTATLLNQVFPSIDHKILLPLPAAAVLIMRRAVRQRLKSIKAQSLPLIIADSIGRKTSSCRYLISKRFSIALSPQIRRLRIKHTLH